MITATFVKKLDGFHGDVKLYHLSEQILYGWEDTHFTDYIAISAAVTYDGPETYIFPANSKGKILDWMELSGSFRGDLDHEKALELGGFSLVKGQEKSQEEKKPHRQLRLE